ncbi:GpE family phage tail protein [Parasphingorhabdus sp.]
MAATFHFPPNQLWEMNSADIDYWHEQARRIADGTET